MNSTHDAVVLAQAEERLRQERELFDQKKSQDQKTFVLRLAIGLDDHRPADRDLLEALGLVVASWKATLGRETKDLEPTTIPSATLPTNSTERYRAGAQLGVTHETPPQGIQMWGTPWMRVVVGSFSVARKSPVSLATAPGRSSRARRRCAAASHGSTTVTSPLTSLLFHAL